MITNHNIVLTGASSGIGFEVLKSLVKGEGNVILAPALDAEEKLANFADNVIPMNVDIGSQAGVDAIFEKAAEVFGGKKIDLYYQNAGFPYYEAFDYVNWDRIARMFHVNTIAPIYTYAKYREHLAGRPGKLAYTISAIGQMAMPGYALYSASKFGLEGFQEAIRVEKDSNIQLTCLYPVATDTNFFRVANPVEFEKPFPVQKPQVVARKMVKGLELGKKSVSPCELFAVSKVLMAVCPPVKTLYWQLENNKLKRFKKKLKEMKK